MTNYEKNKEWLDEHELEFKYGAERLGVDINTKKPFLCGSDNYDCDHCEFGYDCSSLDIAKWLKSEAEEDKVDWMPVQKDTLIEIKVGNSWQKRYFAEYSPDEHLVFYYMYGNTSKTADCAPGCVKEAEARFYTETE